MLTLHGDFPLSEDGGTTVASLSQTISTDATGLATLTYFVRQYDIYSATCTLTTRFGNMVVATRTFVYGINPTDDTYQTTTVAGLELGQGKVLEFLLSCDYESDEAGVEIL
ncbi:hypothetical protein TI39_contig447g00002 [Zymoseptoria brevis]|uniref:Uncharacterized protein n=1 Tax=Zymoseptoria brevis TaxID=1047168 RepID=A0A0F4GLR7_9PEZI|nr:hypothetical protein TI39_contig447g00002 [Zymoseptoria brevis]